VRALPAPTEPARFAEAVRAALDDGPALLLGAQEPVAVPAGTAAVLTTSGSTGYPKRVVLSAAALRASADGTGRRIGRGRWLLALAPTYVAGLQVVVRSVLAGADPVTIPPSSDPAVFADAARALAASSGPVFTSLVPAQLSRLLEADGSAALAALGRFDAVLVGGQELPRPLAERARAAGVRVVRTYGSSETSGGCVYDGVPLDGVGVRIDGSEVQVSGATLADGYLGDAARTAAAFLTDPDGTRWYRTGDAGTLDDGVLRVTGRRDNVIISGGINVSLDRVESAVRSIPGLADAIVVAVEDDRWGQAPAIAAPGPAGPGDAELLAAARAAAARAIGAPARPARLVRLESFPVLTSGKPDRVRIRERVARPLQ
jgi:O-succinylbenzoic acid--CoA ligase